MANRIEMEITIRELLNTLRNTRRQMKEDTTDALSSIVRVLMGNESSMTAEEIAEATGGFFSVDQVRTIMANNTKRNGRGVRYKGCYSGRELDARVRRSTRISEKTYVGLNDDGTINREEVIHVVKKQKEYTI